MAHVELVPISVICSPRKGELVQTQLLLQPNATVTDALEQSGFATHYLKPEWATASVGVWGVICQGDRLLRSGDRVEIYRPLTVDPKEARRQRHKIRKAKK
jgi:uncharacterized protein